MSCNFHLAKLLEILLIHNQKTIFLNLHVKFKNFWGVWQTHFDQKAFLYYFLEVCDRRLKHGRVCLRSWSSASFQKPLSTLFSLLWQPSQSKMDVLDLFLFEVLDRVKLQLFIWMLQQFLLKWAHLLANRKGRLYFCLACFKSFFREEFVKFIN